MSGQTIWVVGAFPRCHTATHTVKQIMEVWTAHNNTLQLRYIRSMKAGLENPFQTMTFFRDSGLFDQATEELQQCQQTTSVVRTSSFK